MPGPNRPFDPSVGWAHAVGQDWMGYLTGALDSMAGGLAGTGSNVLAAIGSLLPGGNGGGITHSAATEVTAPVAQPVQVEASPAPSSEVISLARAAAPDLASMIDPAQYSLGQLFTPAINPGQLPNLGIGERGVAAAFS